MSNRCNPNRQPSYRLHKASGQAVVTIDRKDHYLGKYESSESRILYSRLITKWLQGETLTPPASDSDPSEITVAELAAVYLRWATEYYVKDGKNTTELGNVKRAIRALRETYASLAARDFSPLKLRAVRDKLIADGLCRSDVNRFVGHVIRVFSWAVEREMVPPEMVHGLRELKPLQRGRSQAHETEPVLPVADEDLEATLPHLAERFAAMIRFQLLTGARPGEVCSMTLAEIDRSHPSGVWIYRPTTHKSQHKNKARIIPIGPKAQLVLKPWLPDFSDMLVFRSKWGRRMSADTYRGAVRAACQKAGVDLWSPNQLRHNAATTIREQASLDAAQVILGHSTVATTQIYAEKNLNAALKIAAEVG
jgi:integrase